MKQTKVISLVLMTLVFSILAIPNGAKMTHFFGNTAIAQTDGEIYSEDPDGEIAEDLSLNPCTALQQCPECVEDRVLKVVGCLVWKVSYPGPTLELRSGNKYVCKVNSGSWCNTGKQTGCVPNN